MGIKDTNPGLGGSHPEQNRTELFNAALRERLKPFVPKFLEIRDRFGLGSDIGFGSLPEVHGAYTLGSVTTFAKTDQGLHYMVPGLLFADYAKLDAKASEGILVMPDVTAERPRLISIYQRKGYHEGSAVEERLLTASDDVFVGIIAHELAHPLAEKPDKPDVVTKFLRRRRDDFVKYADDPNGVDMFDLSDEAEFDVIASLYGYKDEILAKLRYAAACLSTYQGADDLDYSLTKTHGYAINETQARIKEVERYCP